MTILVKAGTPIFDSHMDIVGYFKQEMITNGTIKFINENSILGISTYEGTPSIGTKSVRLIDNIWYLGVNTYQHDLESSKYFVMHNQSGYGAKSAAIELLMNDPLFSNMFSDSKHDLNYIKDVYDHNKKMG